MRWEEILNTGCVPSKALIKTAKLVHQIRNSEKYGIKSASYELDFGQVMDRVHSIIAKIAPNDSAERFTGLGVECFKGKLKSLTNMLLRVININNKKYYTRSWCRTSNSPYQRYRKSKISYL